ncbi:hypothetical protein DKAM_0924 [Desulfurococcus amylolyticus 1221n]|uniref:Uncharacterized protein n=1 Tax=Desulfurococcus amylolyticus (strain DSM 18924 / JCM 16383 / VKM B-2413 / 1221n) TaxID=490899 RepID=B8D569_DESA1|nr:hypothetical protein [Desulfurococcus amylolyticus]ACL11250.1 hypothetical protein DKAM_0924 [Desulfurococcus amylolyticus 1221n]
MFQRLIREGYRILKYQEHEFTGDRDRVACINLFLNSRCRVPANTPKPYASPKGIQGEQG